MINPKIECNDSLNVSRILVMNLNDCVFENGTFVRMKRKYGKHKRIVAELNPCKK